VSISSTIRKLVSRSHSGNVRAAADNFAGQPRDDIAAPTGRDELTGPNPDPIRRALSEDVAAGYLSAELAEEIAQNTAAFGGLGWAEGDASETRRRQAAGADGVSGDHTAEQVRAERENQLDAEAAIEDPAAYAEELTRSAPADVPQWPDRLAADPDVIDAQYTNARAAADTAQHSDADSDNDADESG
jgi:hypothetical protein